MDSSQRNRISCLQTQALKGKLGLYFVSQVNGMETECNIVENVLLSEAVKIYPARWVIKQTFCMYILRILASRSKATWWTQNCLPTLSSYKWADVPLAKNAKSCQQNTDLKLLYPGILLKPQWSVCMDRKFWWTTFQTTSSIYCLSSKFVIVMRKDPTDH